MELQTLIQFDTEKYVSIEVSNDLLLSAEEEGFTYLHCTYHTSTKYISGWWVNINEASYLIDTASCEELKLLQAYNIPVAPERHYLKKFGDSLQFTLMFPAVPKNWKTFDFVEKIRPTISHKNGAFEASDGLAIRNITRNNSGVYRVVIS